MKGWVKKFGKQSGFLEQLLDGSARNQKGIGALG